MAFAWEYSLDLLFCDRSAFSISISYLIYIHVGEGLPTYCTSRIVGRQTFAANDKQINQSKLNTVYLLMPTLDTQWVDR